MGKIGFPELNQDLREAIELGGGIDVVDNLTSIDADKALSANMGRVLKDEQLILQTEAHTHPNKPILDKIEDANGILVYDGVALAKSYFLSVYNNVERDAIPMDMREEGLMVLVVSTGNSYYLKGGTDNAFWTIFATGNGGSEWAVDIKAQSPGNLTGDNVQDLLNEIENDKANLSDVYTKAETNIKLDNLTIDYNDLIDLPDLSNLHKHDNLPTLEKFGESQGELTWDGKTMGNMVGEIYDQNGNGIIDQAETLTGLQATIAELNFSKGLTANVQQQLDALSTGMVFKGVFPTYTDMIANHLSSKGDLVYIEQDENHSNGRTQYVYDGVSWVFGGGVSNVVNATNVSVGGIMLTGDLENANGTAQSPQLKETGVTAGLYKNADIVVDEKGRITHAVEGQAIFINDSITSPTETWSSIKISDQLFTKADKNHTHTQLHDADMLGNVRLDTTTLGDKKVITYNAVKGMAEWEKSQGGKVHVGSKYIDGDYTLVAGSYINLFIDEVAKTVTINSTFRDGVANGVPTLVEITGTVFVPSGQTVRESFDASFNKYMINTIRVNNTENTVIDMAIYEQAIGGEYEYLSNKGSRISDILSLPTTDLDQTKKLHLEFTNFGDIDTSINFKIKTTNLI